MKKSFKCMNSDVSYEIAKLGHFDTIAIADAGLPIPSDIKRIDLAVSSGIPSFEDVFNAVISEMKIQSAYIAKEINLKNPHISNIIKDKAVHENAVVVEITHQELKERLHQCKAVIRTGECTSYANVILESNVIF